MYQEEGGVPVLAPRHSHQARMGPAADKLAFNHAFEQRASITAEKESNTVTKALAPVRLRCASMSQVSSICCTSTLSPLSSTSKSSTLNPQPSTKTPRVY